MEEYKANASAGGGNGNGVDAQELEKLKKENAVYLSKIQEAQKKIAQANSLINKAKKYNLCMSYISKFFEDFTPSGDKQTYLFNKLKSFTDEFEKEKNSKKHE